MAKDSKKAKTKQKEEKKVELKQTKGQFKAVGIVNRISNDNAYREGEIEQGRYEGREYRSIRFGVKTSETNELFVEMFGMELDDAYIYKPATKKDKEKGKKGTTKKIAFDERDEVPEGYSIIGITVGLERDEKNKQVRQNLVNYDAVEYVFENLEDGDSVFVSGDIEYSEYEGKKQTKYVIKNISKTKDEVNFDDEKFDEMTSFEQEIVFVDASMDKEEGKLIVIGRVINYGGTYMDIPFVINEEKYPKLVKNFKKRLKFGDFIKVFGNCVNRAEKVETEIDEDEDDWGGGGKPKGFGGTVTHRTTEMEIIDVDSATFEAGKYEEDDFVKAKNLLVDDEEDEDEDSENPFAEDEDDSDDDPFSDDDDDEDE
jgi:hypothetical protein